MKFRFDDVCANTSRLDLYAMTGRIKAMYPDAEIIYAITIFSKANLEGSVYPKPPFKDNPHHFFYDVDQIFMRTYEDITTASHGLIHGDHSRLGYDAQEMSIVMSCKILKTNIFVPPFNRWNSSTEDVCRNNGIKLLKSEDGWKSLDCEDFDSNHELWYLHPWKYNIGTFRKKLGLESVGVK